MPRQYLPIRKYRAAFIFLSILSCLSLIQNSSATALLLEQSRSNNQLACVELVDHKFELSFIHSVSLTPVFDSYQLLNATDKTVKEITQVGSQLNTSLNNNLRILQTQERFIAHGQGLPSLVNEPNALAFEHENGQFILQLHRPIDNLIVRTDKRFENRLYTGANVVNLNQWPDTGILVTPLNRCSE